MTELALDLQAKGHRVTIVCHDFDPGPEFAGAYRTIEVRSVREGPFEIRVGKRAALRQIWREMPKVAALVPGDVDVINPHEWPALHAARLASDRLGVPFAWTRNDHSIFERAVVPGLRNEASRSILARLPRAVGAFPDFLDARRAAAIVVLDTQSASLVKRAFGRNAELIQMGPVESFFVPPKRAEARRDIGVSESAFVALGVGIMAPHRRFEDLIQAIALLGDEPQVIAYIIGSDHTDLAYADSLEQLIDRLRLRGRVTLGRRDVSDDELRAAYAAADVLVFPNDHRQSWGLAPLEALASATPVIVSTASGVGQMLSGRPGVITVAPRSPAAVADALRRSLAGEGREGLEETRSWIRLELSSRRYAERMETLLTAVVDQAGRP
jgi:D-inositol-3-phosphate glycosyltransferase